MSWKDIHEISNKHLIGRTRDSHPTPATTAWHTKGTIYDISYSIFALQRCRYLAERFRVWHTFLCGYFVVSFVALPCEWQSFYSCTRKGFSRKEAIKRWVFHCIIFLCLVLLRLNVSDGKCVFVTLDIFISYLFKLVGKCIFLHNWPPSSHLTVDGVRSLGRISRYPIKFFVHRWRKDVFSRCCFYLVRNCSEQKIHAMYIRK